MTIKKSTIFIVNLILVFVFSLTHDFLDREINTAKILLVVIYVFSSFLVSYVLIFLNYKFKYYYLFFCSALALLALRSSEPSITYNFLLRTFLAFGFFFVGIYTVRFLKMHEIINFLSKALLVFVTYILLSNVLGFGEYFYGESGVIKGGFLSGARLYVFGIIVALWPFLITKNNSLLNQTVKTITIVASAMIIFLLFRRTAILIIVFGSTLYVLLNLNQKNIFKIFLLLSVIGLSSFLFSDKIDQAIAARGGTQRVGVSNLENEKRLMELDLVLNTISSEPEYIVFGTGELFNDRGGYGGVYWSSNRRIHGDIPLIIYGAGLLGVFLFLLFIFIIFRNLLKSNYPKDLRYFVFTLVLIYMITLNTGGIYYFTYNSFVMFLIGYITARYSGNYLKINKYG